MHNPERNFPYINENLSRSPLSSSVRVDARAEYWRRSPQRGVDTIVILARSTRQHNKSLIPAE